MAQRLTLRVDREESVNFDTTRNLFIEGDNLNVLKLLSRTLPHPLPPPPSPRAHKNSVTWVLPGRKRPFSSSTKATSDLLKIYAEDGSTWRQILAKINYDIDAAAIATHYIAKGYGDAHPKLGPLLDENSYTQWWPGKRQSILDGDCLPGDEQARINRRHGLPEKKAS